MIEQARIAIESYRQARTAYIGAYDVMASTPIGRGTGRQHRVREMRRAERLMDRERRSMERVVRSVASELGVTTEELVRSVWA